MSTEMELRKERPAAIAPAPVVQIEQARAIAEVKGAILMARELPRDENLAVQRILKACQRKELAEVATYAFPRGDATVTGPSIRIAEVLAQCWGNMQSGIRVLARSNGESTVQALAWDLETNTRAERVFQVPHVRETKSGKYRLTSERDIYEVEMNQGSRRERACILKLIPGDVQDLALAECEKTLEAHTKDTPAERLKKMVAAFAALTPTVTVSDLENKLRKKLDAFTPADLKSMGRVLLTIQDGMAAPTDYFGVREAKAAGAQAAREAAAKAAGAKKPGAVARMFGARQPEPEAEPTMSPEEEAGAELAFDNDPDRQPGQD